MTAHADNDAQALTRNHWEKSLDISTGTTSRMSSDRSTTVGATSSPQLNTQLEHPSRDVKEAIGGAVCAPPHRELRRQGG